MEKWHSVPRGSKGKTALRNIYNKCNNLTKNLDLQQMQQPNKKLDPEEGKHVFQVMCFSTKYTNRIVIPDTLRRQQTQGGMNTS